MFSDKTLNGNLLASVTFAANWYEDRLSGRGCMTETQGPRVVSKFEHLMIIETCKGQHDHLSIGKRNSSTTEHVFQTAFIID